MIRVPVPEAEAVTVEEPLDTAVARPEAVAVAVTVVEALPEAVEDPAAAALAVTVEEPMAPIVGVPIAVAVAVTVDVATVETVTTPKPAAVAVTALFPEPAEEKAAPANAPKPKDDPPLSVPVQEATPTALRRVAAVALEVDVPVEDAEPVLIAAPLTAVVAVALVEAVPTPVALP